MRQKLITLDPTSWDLAAKKPNFSQWVRDKLRSEHKERAKKTRRIDKECIMQCGRKRTSGLYCPVCSKSPNSLVINEFSEGEDE